VKREFGARDARSPAKVCLAAFADPLIKWHFFKYRIEHAIWTSENLGEPDRGINSRSLAELHFQ
jgi:hypothetical protein